MKLRYKKGNHESAMAGVIAGVVFLAGSIVTIVDKSITAFIGTTNSTVTTAGGTISYPSLITDFLGLIGLVSLIGGVIEYRKVKKLCRW